MRIANYISEGSVSHINGVWPSFLTIELVCSITVIDSTQGKELHFVIKSAARIHASAFFLTLKRSLSWYVEMVHSSLSDEEVEYDEGAGQSSGVTQKDGQRLSSSPIVNLSRVSTVAASRVSSVAVTRVS